MEFVLIAESGQYNFLKEIMTTEQPSSGEEKAKSAPPNCNANAFPGVMKALGAWLKIHYWKVAEISLLCVTVFLGYHAAETAIKQLDENTRSNLATSRGQLYESDNRIIQIDFDQSGGVLGGLYGRPETKDPKEYCDQLMQVFTGDSSLDGLHDATKLYNLFSGLASYQGDESERMIEMRKAYSYLSLILNLMHAAYDYWGSNVISDKELYTWIGYLRDLGPNPFFLAAIRQWKESHYMSRNFAEMLQMEMLRGDANESGLTNREVVHYFYPEMETPQFLSGLREYGKKWTGVPE